MQGARRLHRVDHRRPGARLALDNITKVEVLEYPELGMEAVWKIDVVDFLAFIVVDDKGNDFFEQVRAEARGSPRRRHLTRTNGITRSAHSASRHGHRIASTCSSTGGQTKSGLLMRSDVTPCMAVHIAVVTVKTSGRRQAWELPRARRRRGRTAP